MSDLSSAAVTRVRIASDWTAALIGSIGWLGGVLAQFLVGFSPWWLAAASAIAFLGALFSIRVCRAHSFRVAAIGASQARSSNRQVVVYLSWKAVGDPEWCPTCLHMSRIRVEGTGYTEDGFLGKTIKAHYCEHCAGGNT